jgi:hypothetical protein
MASDPSPGTIFLESETLTRRMVRSGSTEQAGQRLAEVISRLESFGGRLGEVLSAKVVGWPRAAGTAGHPNATSSEIIAIR